MQSPRITAGEPPVRPLRGLNRAAVTMVAVGGVWFAAMLASLLLRGGLTLSDGPVHQWALGIRSDAATSVLAVLTTIAGPLCMATLTGAVALIWFLRTRQWRRPVLLLAAMVLGVLLSTAVKYGVGRGRPSVHDMMLSVSTSYSFPSGHTLGTLIFIGTLTYLGYAYTGRRAALWWGIGATVLFSLAVAFSRIYLGYHWLTDTSAAAGLAVAVVGLVILIDVQIHRLQDRRKAISPDQP